MFNSNNSVRSKKIDLFLTAELGTARDNFLDNVTNFCAGSFPCFGNSV